MKISKKKLGLILFVYLFAFFVFNINSQAEEVPTDASKKIQPKSAPDTKILSKIKAKLSPVKIKKKRAKRMFAEFDTSMGKIKIRLWHNRAPKTVDNFVGLAEGTLPWMDPKAKKKVTKPFYDGLIFHRIIKNFMIQGGDPLGNGQGGPGAGHHLVDEFHPNLLHDKEGVVSMANTGHPNSAGSQFFITLASKPYLDQDRSKGRGYAVFGQVVEGMDVVKKIGAVKTNRGDDKPLEDVTIKTVKIIRK